MSQTLVATTVVKPNTYAVVAGDLALPLTAMDVANGNSFVPDGRDFVLFQNTDTAAHTVTITSVPDAHGRLDTALTAYSIPASSFAVIEMKDIGEWKQPTGLVYMSTTSALIKMAVLQFN